MNNFKFIPEREFIVNFVQHGPQLFWHFTLPDTVKSDMRECVQTCVRYNPYNNAYDKKNNDIMSKYAESSIDFIESGCYDIYDALADKYINPKIEFIIDKCLCKINSICEKWKFINVVIDDCDWDEKSNSCCEDVAWKTLATSAGVWGYGESTH